MKPKPIKKKNNYISSMRCNYICRAGRKWKNWNCWQASLVVVLFWLLRSCNLYMIVQSKYKKIKVETMLLLPLSPTGERKMNFLLPGRQKKKEGRRKKNAWRIPIIIWEDYFWILSSCSRGNANMVAGARWKNLKFNI